MKHKPNPDIEKLIKAIKSEAGSANSQTKSKVVIEKYDRGSTTSVALSESLLCALKKLNQPSNSVFRMAAHKTIEEDTGHTVTEHQVVTLLLHLDEAIQLAGASGDTPVMIYPDGSIWSLVKGIPVTHQFGGWRVSLMALQPDIQRAVQLARKIAMLRPSRK